jgi:hypothetical protein
MRKLFKERKLFKGGNYMRKYGIHLVGTKLPEMIVKLPNAKIVTFESEQVERVKEYHNKSFISA